MSINISVWREHVRFGLLRGNLLQGGEEMVPHRIGSFSGLLSFFGTWLCGYHRESGGHTTIPILLYSSCREHFEKNAALSYRDLRRSLRYAASSEEEARFAVSAYICTATCAQNVRESTIKRFRPIAESTGETVSRMHKRYKAQIVVSDMRMQDTGVMIGEIPSFFLKRHGSYSTVPEAPSEQEHFRALTAAVPSTIAMECLYSTTRYSKDVWRYGDHRVVGREAYFGVRRQ